MFLFYFRDDDRSVRFIVATREEVSKMASILDKQEIHFKVHYDGDRVTQSSLGFGGFKFWLE